MLQEKQNMHIIEDMNDKQLSTKDFVREQIKDKPKNYKRTLMRLGMSAACGVVFALAASVVILLMKPVIQRGVTDESESTETQNTQPEPVTEETQESEKEETDPVVEKEPMTLEDYQQIQTQLYAIGNAANRSIVTITSVVSDTDWFNNSYEREGQGSGTIIGDKGGKILILTEKKVIKNASGINVTFCDDTVAPAELVKYDGNTGLAALAVAKADMEKSTLNSISVMEMGSSSEIHKGSIVIALGSPLGTNYSILTGSITATNNEISTPDNNYRVYTTDIVANQNGSGVLINTDGQLVGIVMQSYGTDSASTLTAVDVTELIPVMDLLFADKDVPYLGVYVSTVTDYIANKYDIPKGVYIKEVEIDSPAMNAGLQNGDVILSIADEKVDSAEEFRETLLKLAPKEQYSIAVMREGTGGYKKVICKFEMGVLQ